jgi:hypothetical protein
VSPKTGGPVASFSPLQKTLAALAVLIYIALGIGNGLHLRPWIDEAWYGTPALTLITGGYMGTPCFDGVTYRLPGVDRHAYWIMPVYPLVQAVWYMLVPFSLRAMRVLATLTGAAGLLFWAYFFRKMTRNNFATIVFLLIASCDYMTLTAAATGRPDILAFAFQAAALASYAGLREKRFNLAILVSQTFVVLSGMTHPNGGMLSFGALLFISLYLDRDKIKLQHFGLAAVPYLAGALGWGLYILQDPASFFAQYGYQTSGRFGGLKNPVLAITREITQRYMLSMGLGQKFHDSRGPTYLKGVSFLMYFAAVLTVAGVRELREKPENRLFLGTLGVFLFFYLFLEETKETYYFCYLLYFYIALLAIALTWLWNKSGAGKTVVTLAMLGIMTIGAAGSVQRMRLDGWGHYQNAVDYIKQHAGPDDLVVGSQELGFLLGFTPNFRDDWGIGVAHGRAPRFIFMEDIYTERYQTEMIQKTPEYPAAIERLKEYKPVFQDEGFKVLERRAGA